MFGKVKKVIKKVRKMTAEAKQLRAEKSFATKALKELEANNNDGAGMAMYFENGKQKTAKFKDKAEAREFLEKVRKGIYRLSA